MSEAPSPFGVDFPTLWVVPEWISAHCVIPDGFRKGQPFEMYDWQAWCTANHYRVRSDVVQNTDPATPPIRAAAFTHRRSQVVGPQKSGKGPWSAAIVCAEAVGPVLFLGWAVGGEKYRCSEFGCGCGWVYEYVAGDPMGRPWPTPLVQLMATSEDQVANVYRPLQAMIRESVLSEQMKIREGFIRLPNDGRIDVVTSSAMTRLGNPTTFALQDETGLYTKQNKLLNVADTQRRSLAGMSGRAMETTNAWDPAEASTAQNTYESRSADLFRFFRIPPANLSYGDKRERRKIHRFNYDGSTHVDLESIEAEAAELMERDPTQAERFFGNRIVHGLGAWLPDGLWEATADERAVSA